MLVEYPNMFTLRIWNILFLFETLIHVLLFNLPKILALLTDMEIFSKCLELWC